MECIELMGNNHPSESVDGNGRAVALLRKNGVRLTRNRLLIIEAFEKYKAHLTAKDLYRYVLQRDYGVGLTSLYRVLSELEQINILRSNRLYDGSISFELACRTTDGSSRLICTRCNRIETLDDADFDSMREKVLRQKGFNPMRDTSTIYAICDDCLSKASPGENRAFSEYG